MVFKHDYNKEKKNEYLSKRYNKRAAGAKLIKICYNIYSKYVFKRDVIACIKREKNYLTK